MNGTPDRRTQDRRKAVEHYAEMAKYAALLAACEAAYTRFGDVTCEWPERHTTAGQMFLNQLKDAIAGATGRDPMEVQDDYCMRNWRAKHQADLDAALRKATTA